jgi:predicted O-methyltransferase YrrM
MMMELARHAFTRLLRAVNADPYDNLFTSHTGERLRKLLSPRYLTAKAQLTLYEWTHPGAPWLTRHAIELIEEHLRPDHIAFEWGSGNGSPWLARRCRALTSVEHHQGWYEHVRSRLAAGRLHNVDYRIVNEAIYPKAIDPFPEEHFDFILVDGLLRDLALLASIPKLKPGGWLVFDNVNWYLPSSSRTPHSRSFADGPATPEFAEAMERVRGWHVIWTSNGVNDTAIFEKPGATSAAPRSKRPE